MNKKHFIAALCAALSFGVAVAAEAPAKPPSILWVGNSLFYYNNSMHNHLGKLLGGALPAATIDQFLPMVNIPPFGMCQSMANPQVAAATAAAMGALTPMPCIPNVIAPWVPPAISTFASALPLATVSSKCVCMWGGMIEASPTIPGSLDVT